MEAKQNTVVTIPTSPNSEPTPAAAAPNNELAVIMLRAALGALSSAQLADVLRPLGVAALVSTDDLCTEIVKRQLADEQIQAINESQNQTTGFGSIDDAEEYLKEHASYDTLTDYVLDLLGDGHIDTVRVFKSISSNECIGDVMNWLKDEHYESDILECGFSSGFLADAIDDYDRSEIVANWLDGGDIEISDVLDVEDVAKEALTEGEIDDEVFDHATSTWSLSDFAEAYSEEEISEFVANVQKQSPLDMIEAALTALRNAEQQPSAEPETAPETRND